MCRVLSLVLLASCAGASAARDAYPLRHTADPAPPEVTVLGAVNRPGRIPYRSYMRLDEAIRAAGDLGPFAHADRVVWRWTLGQEVTGYSVNLKRIRRGQAPDPFVSPGDSIFVSEGD